MERKEKIYLYISSDGYAPLSFDELKVSLDVPDEDTDELGSILEELIGEGKIFLSKKGRYAPCLKNFLFAGVLRCNARGKFGFVSSEGADEDIYIPADAMNTALDGDFVLVKAAPGTRGRFEGVIKKILKRGNRTLSAVVTDRFSAIADNPRIFGEIKLTDMCGAKAGDRVLVEITDYAKGGALFGAVISVLGSSRDLKTYTDAILFEHQIRTEFSEDAKNEARAFAKELTASDFEGRTDFTADTIFTIDGDSAKDFDDAVSVKRTADGGYVLGVHIADVTHYIREGSELDNEAFERGTSVYLPGRVVPMLPPELSDDLCSLKPFATRLTLSVIMDINSHGEVTRHTITKGIIRSVARLTYANAAKILDGDPALCKEYADIKESLVAMAELAQLLYKRRSERGSINFDFPESEITLGSDDRPVKIEKAERNRAHRLIEEFMLAANETVAEFAFWADIPFVYRVHAEPSADKIESFRRFIGNFGLTLKGKEIHPKALRQILESVRETDDEVLIATYMLRSLMKAEYKTECDGHFGLAAKYYCHFTSPIRRYPDLIIHRILKDFIDGKDVMKYKNRVYDAALHSSDTEQTATECERDADDLFKAAYISDYVGAQFPAKISGITSFGIFAELENTVEGLIRLETIHGDYYEFDEENRVLIGRRHGKVYRIGDDLEIEVTGADLKARRIDFVLKGSNVPRVLKKAPRGGHKKYKRNRRGRKNG